MKAGNNNGLRSGALFFLFITSYIPLFTIVIGKQIKDGWAYRYWGGWSKDAVCCYITHFAMATLLTVFSIVGIVGMVVLLKNMKKNLPNGQILTD